MMLFRSAQDTDLDAIFQLAVQSGVGMTTLPKNKELLQKRLGWSTASFKKKLQQPADEYYLFVLEDPDTKTIVGTSALESMTGYDTPFYSYKIAKRTRICHSLNIRSDYEVLSLVNDNQGKAELCTLFLNPEYRKHNNGLLLSKARFLFLAQHPERFAPIVIAEMRGISDEEGQSPFWNNIGQHFFHMPFAEADRLTLATNKQFIADLMPRNAIYIKLLSPQAQEVIGKPHSSTVPAMNILMNEGFRFNNYVDIFDAGPTIESPLTDIKTVKSSRIMSIKSLSDEVSSSEYLMANTAMDFRATIHYALINNEDSHCIISKQTAELLKVKRGEPLRIAPMRCAEKPPLP